MGPWMGRRAVSVPAASSTAVAGVAGEGVRGAAADGQRHALADCAGAAGRGCGGRPDVFQGRAGGPEVRPGPTCPHSGQVRVRPWSSLVVRQRGRCRGRGSRGPWDRRPIPAAPYLLAADEGCEGVGVAGAAGGEGRGQLLEPAAAAELGRGQIQGRRHRFLPRPARHCLWRSAYSLARTDARADARAFGYDLRTRAGHGQRAANMCPASAPAADHAAKGGRGLAGPGSRWGRARCTSLPSAPTR